MTTYSNYINPEFDVFDNESLFQDPRLNDFKKYLSSKGGLDQPTTESKNKEVDFKQLLDEIERTTSKRQASDSDSAPTFNPVSVEPSQQSFDTSAGRPAYLPTESTQTDSSTSGGFTYDPSKFIHVVFKNDETKTRSEQLDPKMKQFLALCEQENIPIRVTSTWRSREESSADSHHPEGLAVDITPIDGQDYAALARNIATNPTVREYMKQNGIGILDETSEETRRKTGGNAPHYHVGIDNSAVEGFQKILNQYSV